MSSGAELNRELPMFPLPRAAFSLNSILYYQPRVFSDLSSQPNIVTVSPRQHRVQAYPAHDNPSQSK